LLGLKFLLPSPCLWLRNDIWMRIWTTLVFLWVHFVGEGVPNFAGEFEIWSFICWSRISENQACWHFCVQRHNREWPHIPRPDNGNRCAKPPDMPGLGWVGLAWPGLAGLAGWLAGWCASWLAGLPAGLARTQFSSSSQLVLN